MLFYGLTEEELCELEEDGWEHYREEGETVFMKTYETPAGTAEVAITTEEGSDNPEHSWEVFAVVDGAVVEGCPFIADTVPAAAAAAEVLIEKLGSAPD